MAVLFFTALFVALYIVIWLTVYFIVKSNAKKLNATL
jgi:sensor domain CHASE-containing protein